MKPFRNIGFFGFIFALSALGVLTAATFSGCSSDENEEGLRVFHGSIRDYLSSVDPANAYDEISMEILPNIYETLYQYSYTSSTFRVVPLLAADMPTISKDQLVVTIPIRRGIRFHHDSVFKTEDGAGRELKAKDFVYALKRLAVPSIRSKGWFILDGRIKGINAFHDDLMTVPPENFENAFNKAIEGLQALDDYVLRIRLTRPYPQLLYALSMTFAAPLAQEAVEKYSDEKGNITDHPIGTGPFKMKVWNRHNRVILERNEKFRPEFYPTEGSSEFSRSGLMEDGGKTLPFLDRVVFKTIRDPAKVWKEFVEGKLEKVILPREQTDKAIVHHTNLSPAYSSKGLRLNINSSSAFYYLSLNLRDPILGRNKYIRQAISSAIDRDKWIDIVSQGRGVKMTSILPKGLADRPKNSHIKYDFNLKKAKELLIKAGFPGGKGIGPVTIEMRGADALNRDLGEFFEKSLGAIGIRVKISFNSFPSFLEKQSTGAFQISYGGWTLDYPDAENIFQLAYGPNKVPGMNESSFDDSKFNDLFKKMASMPVGPARAEIIEKMEDILQEEAPWILGYFHADYELSQPWLFNYRTGDLFGNRYKYLRINQDVKKRYLDSRQGL
ncbi:hypothetical protein K2X30_02760 [bacterium]|nr:hypothetical protein [bacterium]